MEPKNDEEKMIINYYRTKADNYQPNLFIGLVILNTQNPSMGLQNVGATCYMNATLQCLIHIKELSEIFLSVFFTKYPKEDANFIKDHLLSSEYVNILLNDFYPKLYGNELNSFAPHKFKQLVGELNPLFSGFMAKDAKDFTTIHSRTYAFRIKNGHDFFLNYPYDQRDEYFLIHMYIKVIHQY